MGIKPDHWIIKMARSHQMIEPFEEQQVRKGISLGVSSYGYDISLADEFRVPHLESSDELDPKRDNAHLFDEVKDSSVLIAANSFVLARSQEYLKIPRNIAAVCFGKSTYARCGVVVNVTPLEPEWEGYITISISNTAPCPVRVYANEGIAQVLFLEAAEVCEVSYADKKGKYQAQKGITLSKAD